MQPYGGCGSKASRSRVNRGVVPALEGGACYFTSENTYIADDHNDRHNKTALIMDWSCYGPCCVQPAEDVEVSYKILTYQLKL